MNATEGTERAILGSILFDHELLDQTSRPRERSIFAISHQQIFQSMRRMANVGQSVDSVTLLECATQGTARALEEQVT